MKNIVIKIIKYLKPFILLVVSAVFLLFAQAMCDLALPDYMSDIVNTGIQQGGIENSVPEAVGKGKMDKLVLFMDKNTRGKVLGDYKLVDKKDGSYSKYLKKYPKLQEEPVYVLKNIDRTEINEINDAMGRSFIAVSKLSETKRGEIGGEINKKFASLGSGMIDQVASPLIKSEYKRLGMDTDRIQRNYIMHTGAMMLFVSLLSVVCTVMVGLLAARTSAGLSKNLRRNLFTKIENFSSSEFNKFSTASLITRTTNDITQIQIVVFLAIRMVIYAPILGVGGIMRAIGKSSSMSWIIVLAVIVLLGVIGCIFLIAFPRFKIIQKLVDRLNLITRENLSGMMVIRAFNNQSFEEKKFDGTNKNLTDVNLFVNRTMAFMFPAMMFIMNIITILIVWVGAHQIANSSMQVGDMMAFMQYAMQIIFAFLMMSFMFIMIPRASVSAQRINEVLEVSPSIVDPEMPEHFPDDTKGVVEFENVCFKYEGAEGPALEGISFKAYPGCTTAFIGSTGSGKSTLVKLLPRFYDVTSGCIKIDGVDIRNVGQHELRSLIGYVPQKGMLFKGTIEYNLKYANENATRDQIEKAAQIAQAQDFIKEKPEGFKAEISQGGANVSGGQKQRLSIARALVKNPRIYVFDDSFSALDFKTDSALRHALKSETSASTVLIVAQRISTIKDADQIIVLDEGRIVGSGTHVELMKSCSTYREIALSQLSKEELA